MVSETLLTTLLTAFAGLLGILLGYYQINRDLDGVVYGYIIFQAAWILLYRVGVPLAESVI